MRTGAYRFVNIAQRKKRIAVEYTILGEKRDIAPIEDAGALIMGLRPRQYRLRSEGKDGKRHTGFIAQHVLKLAPDWAAADGEDKDNLGLMYGEILAPLVQVVQDQQKRIEALEAILEKQGQNLA